MSLLAVAPASRLIGLAGVLGAVIYVFALKGLDGVERNLRREEMRVNLPRIVQLIAAGGDRYLAADLATIRALVAPIEGMNADQYRIQAIVQKDAAWLNPAHLDNYYIAAAVLPWNGELDAAQFVLRKAHDARPFDIWPAYQYGFYEWHLRKNAIEGAHWLNLAAERTRDFAMRYSLKDLAARWMGAHDDLELAIRLTRGMAEQSRDKAFTRYLMLRAQRLEGLLTLRGAVERFRALHGKNPGTIEELIVGGMIPKVPEDPFKIGYAIDSQGNPVFKNMIKRAEPAKRVDKQ